MSQENTNPEGIKQHYFQIRSSSVEHLRDLIHELKNVKSYRDDKNVETRHCLVSTNMNLQDKIKELEQELENLKNTKKYWLVWDNEKEPEQVVLDCQRKLPILKEHKNKKILNDESWESNILIQWDNYHALQVLNYTHKEAIDVIYIDPPYNTWNKDFIYNDKYIDKEDTYRHSKWLNFMSKRLELAYDLLKEDWVIFISIDDNEQAQLKLLCDDIFWEENFVAQIVWRKTENIKMDSKYISWNTEYILCYIWKLRDSFNKQFSDVERFNLQDEKWKYYLRKLDSKSSTYSKWMDYIIEHEWKKYYAWSSYEKYLERQIKAKAKDATWLWSQNKYLEWFKSWEIIFKNWNVYNKVRYDWIAKKPYISLINDISQQTWQKELDDLFWNRVFDHPKPTLLIKKLLSIVSKKDSLILDFTAWSWTTWHAVLDLNKEDWGNRKFILCTNNENNICEEITYERIKRVSNWYTNSKWNEIAWLLGNLRYYETEFVEVENLTDIDDEKKLELTYNAWELLAIKEWIYNELEKNSYWQIFESQKDIVAVYFKETAENINEMMERLAQIQKQKWWKVVWYIYWNPYKKETFKKIRNLELKDIPDPILKVYREINKV